MPIEILTWRMSHSAYPLIVPLAYSHLFSFGREMTAAMVIKANPERAHGAHGHGVQVYAAPTIFAVCIASHRTASDLPSTRTRRHVGDRCGWSDRERKKSKHKKDKKTKRGGEHRTNQLHVLIVVLLRPCAAVNRWWSWLPVRAVLSVVHPLSFYPLCISSSVSHHLCLLSSVFRPPSLTLRLSSCGFRPLSNPHPRIIRLSRSLSFADNYSYRRVAGNEKSRSRDRRRHTHSRDLESECARLTIIALRCHCYVLCRLSHPLSF